MWKSVQFAVQSWCHHSGSYSTLYIRLIGRLFLWGFFLKIPHYGAIIHTCLQLFVWPVIMDLIQ
jgi:hypothetical protein